MLNRCASASGADRKVHGFPSFNMQGLCRAGRRLRRGRWRPGIRTILASLCVTRTASALAAQQYARSIAKRAALCRCHELAWTLDAGIRNGSLTDKHLEKLGAFFEGVLEVRSRCTCVLGYVLLLPSCAQTNHLGISRCSWRLDMWGWRMIALSGLCRRGAPSTAVQAGPEHTQFE